MKKHIKYLFIPILLIVFFSCQRELNFEEVHVSGNSLKSNLTGDCLPKKVMGTYIKGKDLGDTNYIEVDVDVTHKGPYVIMTDTVNGYSFKGTGTFSTIGSNTIKLAGQGKPLAAGDDYFAVMYDTSICHILVSVEPAPVIITPAVFTFQGAPGTCTPTTVSGTYIKGYYLTPEDTVSIDLMVNQPGSYAITTDTVNGYRFIGSGVLTGTGLQTISLTGIGAPINGGTNIFTISAASGCTFPVIVKTAVQVINDDYFPLTDKSYWIYNDLLRPGDTIKRVITDTVRKNGLLYHTMEERDVFGGNVQSFFRKDGFNYFEYASIDKYTASFSYSPRLFGELPILKENIFTGGWATTEFTGTFSAGQTIFLQYNYYCIDGDAAVTLSSNSFVNVYKLRLLPQVRSQFAPLGSTGEIIDMYFAKGVGLIYMKGTNNGNTTIELQIRDWKVY